MIKINGNDKIVTLKLRRKHINGVVREDEKEGTKENCGSESYCCIMAARRVHRVAALTMSAHAD